MIRISNLHKSFGKQVVLDGINLHLLPKETTTIVGPSGVGKSVLLKLIMGILEPEQGQILIGTDNITTAENERKKNEIRSQMGVLFQSAALFDSLSVYENVAFPLQARSKLNRSEINDRVNEMLEELSLLKYRDRLPQEISIGIRKRVGMARALVMEPKIFLFDEPNTGLDPLDGQEVYDLIKTCKNKWHFTGIVISHEIPEVFQISDRVIMLFGGRIVADGTPSDLANSPNPVVQQFIRGDINGPIKIQ